MKNGISFKLLSQIEDYFTSKQIEYCFGAITNIKAQRIF
jgi:hypothetical protein